MSEDLSKHIREQFVTSLIATGVRFSPAIQHALLTTSREAYVPCFYKSTTYGNTGWEQICMNHRDPETFLKEVYTDDSLVVAIDQRGWPVSSSSKPSVMIAMVEALDIKKGQRVLEIGTGTGYNAALLTALTGDPHLVTTIEYDETLAINAAKALTATIGEGITVHRGDGFAGYEPHAPYDCILATASAATLPLPWIHQLAPGGRLVMDLHGPLASGFLILDKAPTSIMGYFREEPLHFMPMSSESEGMKRNVPQLAHLMQQPCQGSFLLPEGHEFPDILSERSFRWFLQWAVRGYQIRKQIQSDTHYIFLVNPHSQATLLFRHHSGDVSWQVSLYGSSSLWDELEEAYHHFVALGRPQPKAYQVRGEGERLFLCIGELKLPL